MLIYKICTAAMWEETERTGIFPGMPIDIADGYVHFQPPNRAPRQLESISPGSAD